MENELKSLNNKEGEKVLRELYCMRTLLDKPVTVLSVASTFDKLIERSDLADLFKFIGDGYAAQAARLHVDFPDLVLHGKKLLGDMCPLLRDSEDIIKLKIPAVETFADRSGNEKLLEYSFYIITPSTLGRIYHDDDMMKLVAIENKFAPEILYNFTTHEY